MQPAPEKRPALDGGEPVSDGSACLVGVVCASDNPDQGCGTLTLKGTTKMTVKPGNLLIIFDQSGSMNGEWQMTTKLEAAKAALIAAITPLADLLTVGAIFLPSAGSGCRGGGSVAAVAPIDGPGNIPFSPGPQFLDAFNAHWSMASMNGGGTPLNEAFDRADVALKAAQSMLMGQVAVLVFTDGMPNCTPDPAVTMVPTEAEPQRAADWFVQNILTYLVGLPGADGVTYLNDIAVNGGTGMYLTPDNPMTLTDKLMEIVKSQISTSFDSCAIDLNPATSAPDKLQLVVEERSNPGQEMEVPRDLGSAGGWTISSDGVHIELNGEICDAAKSGAITKLTFKLGCKDIPPVVPGHIG
jgi:hypothetical protein